MKKFRLTKCFPCFSGYPCPKKDGMIPRKMKKEFKKFISLGFYTGGSHFMLQWPEANSCCIGKQYKEAKKLLKKYNYLLRYKDAINFLLNCTKAYGHSDIEFNDDMKLGFNWEYDNGLYTTGGVEPFHFEPQKNGWQYDELYEILNDVGIEINTVKDEKALLHLIDKMIKEGKLFVVKNQTEFGCLADLISDGKPIRKLANNKLRFFKRKKRKNVFRMRTGTLAPLEPDSIELPF